MFELFQRSAEWWLIGLFSVLLVGPVAFYLTGPWTFRRDEILQGISASAADRYFRTFYSEIGKAARAAPTFARFYSNRFGRQRYVIPTVVMLATGITSATWTTASILVWTGLRPAVTGVLDRTSAAALSGAYLWVIADLIARWKSRDLSPSDLWWSTWRIVLAVPLAFAISAMLNPTVAVPVAFLLGAFPTRSISTLARRFARRALNLGADVDEKSESELEKLQGIDTRIAERFADEGITTVVQLAYVDPVELTMRCSSLSFSFVIDCSSQALAWLYFGDDLAKLRSYSLRGAQEIASLVEELDGENEQERAVARDTLKSAAGVVGVNAVAFERSLREIAADPYTDFICAVWAVTDSSATTAQDLVHT